MISLSQLILASPLTDEDKKELLAKEASLPVEKKIEVEQLCWSLIATAMQNDLLLARQTALVKMAKGEGSFSQDDFKRIEDELLLKLIKSMRMAETERSIQYIRQKINSEISKSQ
jgi:hypothetical protein